MVDFNNINRKSDKEVVKRNIHNERFFIEYTKIVSNTSSLEKTKEIDIKFYKKQGYDVLTAVDIEKIKIIPEAETTFQNFINLIQQGLALCFISECYEPFRIFDTEEEQSNFTELQEKNNVRDSDLIKILSDNNYIAGRNFMDDWGHIQTADNHGNIAKRDDETGKVIVSKGANRKAIVEKMAVECRHFSLKTLQFALDIAIKQNESKLKSEPIKKNLANKKN